MSVTNRSDFEFIDTGIVSRQAVGNKDLAPDSIAYHDGLLPTGKVIEVGDYLGNTVLVQTLGWIDADEERIKNV